MQQVVVQHKSCHDAPCVPLLLPITVPGWGRQTGRGEEGGGHAKVNPGPLCSKHVHVSPVGPLAGTHCREREMKNSILSQILDQDARARCMPVCPSLSSHMMSHVDDDDTWCHDSHFPTCSEQHSPGEAGQGQDGGVHAHTNGPHRPAPRKGDHTVSHDYHVTLLLHVRICRVVNNLCTR